MRERAIRDLRQFISNAQAVFVGVVGKFGRGGIKAAFASRQKSRDLVAAGEIQATSYVSTHFAIQTLPILTGDRCCSNTIRQEPEWSPRRRMHWARRRSKRGKTYR